MKDLVKKCWKDGRLDQNLFDMALLEWRNTPKSIDSLAPSQHVFGFLQRTSSPGLPSIYRRLSKDDLEEAMDKKLQNAEKNKFKYDLRSRNLPNLRIGQMVFIQDPINKNWQRKGIIVERRNNGRSYLIESNGSKLLRNRRLLKPCFEGGM
jgi:hypothetical protein